MDTDFRNITGTFDILPDSYESGGSKVPGAPQWVYVETVIREVMERFGFEEIRTPILEPTELVARGVGQLTDIVTKEMFAFERGDTHYVMRPEITAPVMRAFLQHRLDQRGGVQKLFYIGPCFRAERPQKGRYRQFHQFGVEVIGASDARADAETIACMMAVYQELGLDQTELRLNSLGDAETRPAYKKALTEYLEPYRGDLSETSRRRLDENPLRILDTKLEHEQKILEDAPRIADFLGEESREHYQEVRSLLDDLGVSFKHDPFLVRGLDYYTETAFEVEGQGLGAQSELGGGGRYDLLAQEIGSDEPVPAVGFAAGLDRLFLALDAAGAELPESPRPDAFLVALGDAARRWVFSQAQALRQEGLQVNLDLKSRSMKAQMREADRHRARFAVIVGDRELEDNVAGVKDLASGDQVDVPVSELAEVLKSQTLPADAA